MPKYLNKQQILAAPDLKHADVDVPEWGGKVRIRALTAGDALLYQDRAFDITGDGSENGKAKISHLDYLVGLVALSIVDEQDNPMFVYEEVQELGKKSHAALKRVFDAAQDLSGMGAGKAEKN